MAAPATFNTSPRWDQRVAAFPTSPWFEVAGHGDEKIKRCATDPSEFTSEVGQAAVALRRLRSRLSAKLFCPCRRRRRLYDPTSGAHRTSPEQPCVTAAGTPTHIRVNEFPRRQNRNR